MSKNQESDPFNFIKGLLAKGLSRNTQEYSNQIPLLAYPELAN